MLICRSIDYIIDQAVKTQSASWHVIPYFFFAQATLTSGLLIDHTNQYKITSVFSHSAMPDQIGFSIKQNKKKTIHFMKVKTSL